LIARVAIDEYVAVVEVLCGPDLNRTSGLLRKKIHCRQYQTATNRAFAVERIRSLAVSKLDPRVVAALEIVIKLMQVFTERYELPNWNPHGRIAHRVAAGGQKANAERREDEKGRKAKVLAFYGAPGARRKAVPVTEGTSDWRERPCDKTLGWLIEHNQMATYAANQFINITPAGLGMAYFDASGPVLSALAEVFERYPHDKELCDRLKRDLARTQRIILLLRNLPPTDESMRALVRIYHILEDSEKELAIPSITSPSREEA
jgi:hypothetical protein